MLERKHYKLLVIFAFFVLAIVINEFFLKEITLQDKMQDALNRHDHENALIFASRLLKETPGNRGAIGVIKKSGQILLYLQRAQKEMPDFRVAENRSTEQVEFYVYPVQTASADSGISAENMMVEPAKVYEDIKKAKAYIAKAKMLDPDFKTTLIFEKNLNEAQFFVFKMLAANIFDVGKNVYSDAFKYYGKKSELVESAATSEYLNKFLAFQSAWAPIETPIDEIKKKIEPSLNIMDDASRLISAYKSGKAKSLSESLLSYLQVVRKSVDVLLDPKGSYKDFMKVASNSTNEYQKAKNNLMRALPKTANVNDFSKPIKLIAGYELFKNDATIDLIKENKHIQGT